MLVPLAGILLYRTGIVFRPDENVGHSQIGSDEDRAIGTRTRAPMAIEAPDQQGPPATNHGNTATAAANRGSIAFYFYPNDANPLKRVARQRQSGRISEELYDPGTPAALDHIRQIVARIGEARIDIRGHTDHSISSHDSPAARSLSLERAQAVAAAIRHTLADLSPPAKVSFSLEGDGREQSAEAKGSGGYAPERRCDVAVLSASPSRR